jgi:hypothetical protein
VWGEVGEGDVEEVGYCGWEAWGFGCGELVYDPLHKHPRSHITPYSPHH